jgi:hypothetical protein
MFLTELAEPQLLVIYPGRFQPFHKGHYAVYEWLTGKFGRNNVYIATSNRTDALKSPFTFSEKSYFMQLTGVPADRIIQAAQPYRIEDILAGGHLTVADPANTVVVFAVSQKDMEEDPRFSFAPKKDGSESYFQPLKDIKQTESMQKHGYIMVAPTFQFDVAGDPMESASEIRAKYKTANKKQRRAIVTDLFGRYTPEAEHIMNNKLTPIKSVPKPKLQKTVKLQKVDTPKDPVDEGYYNKLDVERQEQGLLPVFEIGRYQNGRWVPTEQYNNYAQAQAHAQHIKNKYPSMEVGIKTQDGQVKLVGLKEEAAGVGVVRGGQDPRYMTATMGNQNAVTGATLGKEMRAFGLAGRKSPAGPTQQKKVKASIGQGIREDLAWVRERLGESAVDQLAARHIEYINQNIDAIKERIATEKLSAEYVAKLKERIVALEKERAQLAWNPK